LSAHPNDENAANESMMPKAPTTETIAAGLSVPERILLFCLASGTDWVKAGIPTITARNLVDHDHATRFVLTEQGRAVLAALLKPL
jgi:hypothetical protein